MATSAARIRYFNSLGLPISIDGCQRNQLESPWTDPGVEPRALVWVSFR